VKPVSCITAVLILLLCWASTAAAHEVRPAYLRILQSAQEVYETTWRVPAKGDMRLGIYLEMPQQCQLKGDQLNWKDGATFVEQGTWACAGGLVGGEVAISGLELMLTDALARVERLDGTTQVARITPSKNSFTVTSAESWSEVAFTYLALGVEHILLGIDHLLFVLALLLLVPNTRMLVWTITSFTLAHSVTLAAATLGLVNIPQKPVEAVIALSILFVAMEIVHWKQGRPGITRRWPWLVAFTFGLLHGFGFAGALSEIGLPEHAIPLALLFFNLGVEAGQLMFIAAVLVLWAGLKRVSLPRWAWRAPVYGIGSLAAFWTIERIAGFVA
jgi:hydrogenase/urease accessory protein HupE